MPATLSSTDINWDLSRLYADAADPRIAADQAQIERRIAALERHRGTIATGDARHIAAVLEELEETTRTWNRITSFAHLLACVDEEDEHKVALRERYDALSRKWQARLVFIDLELQRIAPDRLAGLLDD